MAETKKAVEKTVKKPRLAKTRGKQPEGKWFLMDAKGKILGRLAVQVARLLTGKDKKTFLPHWESGDSVVVINAKEITVSGTKRTKKMYKHYTGYQGGLKEYNFEKLMEKDPTAIIKKAVKGMLPKNRLGSRMLNRLFVYSDDKHKQQAQKPEILETK